MASKHEQKDEKERKETGKNLKEVNASNLRSEFPDITNEVHTGVLEILDLPYMVLQGVWEKNCLVWKD